MHSKEKLANFFDEDIFDLDENEVYVFLIEEEVRIQESGVWREIEWGFKPQPISGNL